MINSKILPSFTSSTFHLNKPASENVVTNHLVNSYTSPNQTNQLTQLIDVLEAIIELQKVNNNISTSDIEKILPNGLKNPREIANMIKNIFSPEKNDSKSARNLAERLVAKLYSLNPDHPRNFQIISNSDILASKIENNPIESLSELIPIQSNTSKPFYINHCIQYDKMTTPSWSGKPLKVSHDILFPYCPIKDDNTPILLIIPGSHTCNPEDYKYLHDKLNIPAVFIPHRGSPNNNLLEAPKSNEEMISPTLKAIDYFTKLYPNRKICVYGHSLGGAIAAEAVYRYKSNPNINLIADRAISSLSETIKYKASLINNILIKFAMHVISWFTTSNYFFNYELSGKKCYDLLADSRKINFYSNEDPNLGNAVIKHGNLLTNDTNYPQSVHMRQLHDSEIEILKRWIRIK